MICKPARLRPDNFTPPARTPWGGRAIAEHHKRQLELPGWDGVSVVGESWELSVSPEFPGRLEDDRLLADVIAADPDGWLGAEALAGRSSTALLVKWLDAADNLSVQIHPDDGYADLSVDQCGKPEAWYVVGCKAGAGIYLGLAEGADESQVRACLEASGDFSRLLRFVPVHEGDFFLLDPGTPHAVGAGCTLIEPQHVAPGMIGVTYRYWDWNRSYAPDGQLDPDGKPRPLHVEDALAVTRFDRAGDSHWLASRQVQCGPADPVAPPSVQALCGSGTAMDSSHLRVARLTGTGTCELPAWPVLMGLTVIEGAVYLPGGLQVAAGQSAVIPATCSRESMDFQGAHALLSATGA